MNDSIHYQLPAVSVDCRATNHPAGPPRPLSAAPLPTTAQVGRKQGATKPVPAAACLPASGGAIGHSWPASVDSRHAPVETDAARIDSCLFSQRWRHVAAGPTRVPSKGPGRWPLPPLASPPRSSCHNQRHNDGPRSEWLAPLPWKRARPAGRAGALQVIRRCRRTPTPSPVRLWRTKRAETAARHGSAARVLPGFASFRKGRR